MTQADEDAGPHQPHIEHGNEALAAREHLGRVAVARQDVDRLVKRRRRAIFERRRLHRCSRRAAAPASLKRTSGETGHCRTSLPSGRTASATAQTIAPTPPIIPPSAAPFVPFTENGDG